ncbi:MAG TPA: hypothetical protein VNM41_09065, partial [Solirubrobacterales bacterium]|nr:hypothetical protein [Solirubrobacterales bacterium]
MRFLRPLAAALLFASTMQAATVTVEPPNPTSAIPVVLLVTESDTCPPPPVVTRDGFSISVVLGAGPCLSPPVLITYRL